MDRFFLGMLTGLAGLVAPLLLASLFLPGPDGTFLGRTAPADQQSVNDAKAPSEIAVDQPVSEQDAAEAKDDPTPVVETEAKWTRRDFDQPRFSVETPDDWFVLNKEDLQELDKLGAAAAIDTTILAVANSKSEDDVTGMALFMDVGPVRLDSLTFVEAMEQQIASTMPILRVKEKAQRARFDDFKGATVVFETTPAAALLSSKVDQQFSLVEMNGRAIIMALTSVPGTPSVEIVKRIEDSLRAR